MKKPSKIATLARQGYQGATLGFGDELIDYTVSPIVAALTGQKLSDVVDQARGMSAEDLSSDKENGKTALLAQILGGLPSAVASSPRIAAQAGMGALQGYGSGQGGIVDRLDDAAIGGALGGAGQAVSKGVSRVTKGASDLISPEVRKTAQKLKSMGIPVRLSQLMDSRFLAAVDKAISVVPFSGAAKSQAQQRAAFEKNLLSTFGETADKLDEYSLGSAKTRLSGEYDRLLQGKDIPIDRQSFAQNLSQLVDDLALDTDDAGADLLSKQAERILNTIDNGGQLNGKSYQNLRRGLKEASKKEFGIRKMKDFLDTEVRNAVPENIGAELGKIDGQYRNMQIGKTIYEQLQNSGGVKPESVYNAAKRSIPDMAFGGGGELGSLARAGRLLKPIINDSGTAEQLAAQAAVRGGLQGSVLSGAGIASYFEPTTALAALGTIGTARGLNSVMTSKYLQEGMGQGIQNAATKLVNSKAIPSVLRAGQGSQNAEASYDPSQDPELQGMMNGYNPDEDPELQVLLGGEYDPNNDPELQAVLSSETMGGTETLPAVNAPMRVTENAQSSGIRPRVKADIERLMRQGYSVDDLLIVAQPQMDSNMKFEDGTPIWQPEDIQYLQSLKGGSKPKSNILGRIQQAESGGNPNARNPNSSASGLYQFTDPTWQGMMKNYPEAGLTMENKNDPKAQALAAALLTDENTKAYKAKGIEPNEADLYAAHFLGAPAAVKAKQYPDAYGAEQFPQAAAANKSIFYQNGRPRTNEEINRLLGQKIGVM